MEFSVSGNGFMTGPLPHSLPNASQIQTIEMSENLFTGSIPSQLGNCQDLAWLAVGWNRLGTQKPDDLSFITSLSNCTMLSYLDVGINYLRGELPNSLAISSC